MKVKTMIVASLLLALVASIFISKYMKQTKSPDLPELFNANNEKLDPITLKDKIVIVSYFQTWCRDCIKEQPELMQLQNHFGKDKLQILLVTDESFELVEKFKQLYPSGLEYFQSKQGLKKDLGVKAFPTTILYGKDGLEKLKKVEGIDWYNDEMIQTIESLLK